MGHGPTPHLSTTEALSKALHGCPAPTASTLRAMGRLRRWSDGDTVLHGGVRAATAVVIVSGWLRMATASESGKEVLFRWFTPGEFVGLVSIFGNLPLPVEAAADGPCETIHFDAEQLLAHLRSDAAGALFFAGLVSRFASEIASLLVVHTTGSLEERILAFLTRLALHAGADPTQEDVRLNSSQQDIAVAVGASRQRVAIELHKLAARNRIQLGYRHIVLRPSAQTALARRKT